MRGIVTHDTPEELIAYIQQAITAKASTHDIVAALAFHECTFDTVIAPLGHAENEYRARVIPTIFAASHHRDKALRDAAGSSPHQAFDIAQSMRRDIYERVNHVVTRTELSHLPAEDMRLAHRILRDFIRNGVPLSEEKQQQLNTLKRAIGRACARFVQNINENRTTVAFTREELEGVPDFAFQGMLQMHVANGVETYHVPLRLQPSMAVMMTAKRADTRKRLNCACETMCVPNVELLQQITQMRREYAKILGYPSHAAYKLETFMLDSEDRVANFLEELKNQISPIARKEFARLEDLKQADVNATCEADGATLQQWDYPYYNRIMRERELGLGSEALMQYFPIKHVLSEMLSLYASLLSLSFTELPPSSSGFPAWDPACRWYNVVDAQSRIERGQFCLDLFHRDGKAQGASVHLLRPGYDDEHGHTVPVVVMSAAFPPETGARPTCLKHDDVVALFHELGHIMHNICSTTKWARFHGVQTEWDFVETPSRMLENWTFEPAVLDRISRHVVSALKMPADVFVKLHKARGLNLALQTMYNIFSAAFDIKIHGAEPVKDMGALWSALREEHCFLPRIPNTHPQAIFAHVVTGYDVGMYGYTWSEVVAADLFQTRFTGKILDQDAWSEYRELVLRPGGTSDAWDILNRFLGRQPTMTAFVERMRHD
ncbi:hypothetical protein SeMB42_g00146 [Synchytrium endobioticum]|uniref:Peptidase M3A/M3B catalytic domain-containing protein n=1 Tax=Synchytrium endobioticum TaxID=286115 RepID=A0A507DTY8_9FUNG|nr:hypothetical protein SeMB42_g00146 [Synchytrium endobioticum]